MIELSLSNKRALVCGASEGVGRACAIELAQLGAEVILIARHENTLQRTLSELSTAHGQQHQLYCIDLENHPELELKINQCIQQKGAIEVLVNNCGGPKPGPIHATKLDVLQKALDGHLKASILLSQLLLEGMKQNGFGRIINITSTSVKTPLESLGISNTTRWAVAAWAKTLSYEVAQYGITVNNVLPGSIDTRRTKDVIQTIAQKHNCSTEQARKLIIDNIPAGYLGSTKQIADVVAFLASPAASYINGVALAVDGGRTRAL